MITKIGKHKVRHGDIHNVEEIKAFTEGVKADVFYSDPPWGSGNLKYWDTMNKKMNNIQETTGNFDVDVFLQTVLESAKRNTDGWVVIEYGKKWIDKVIEKAESAGLIYCNQVETLYANNLPMQIIFFRTDKKMDIDLSTIYHLKGYKCVREVFKLLKPKDGGLGMDLCCGMGYTAQACIDNKMSFIGNELNEKRLGKTIVRLEKDKNK